MSLDTAVYSTWMSLFGIPVMAYSILILWYRWGWGRLKRITQRNSGFTTMVTVVIPTRNEEENISDLLYSIIRQDYPENLLQVIVADDGSTDQTLTISHHILSKLESLNWLVISGLMEGVSTKKNLINCAVHKSDADLIICVDGDCRVGPEWVSAIVTYYELYHPRMISGPVVMHSNGGFFQGMLQLEFMSLVGIGGASAAVEHPLMCNGANLAFQRTSYLESCPYSDNSSILSGDDMFMMVRFNSLWPGSVHFIKDLKAIVLTAPPLNLWIFIHQRIRWSSKTKHLKSYTIQAVAALVFVVNLAIVGMGISAFFIHDLVYGFLLLMIMKMIADLIFLWPVAHFFNHKKLLLHFLPASLFVPLYTVFIAIIGSIGSHEWKGRAINNSGHHLHPETTEVN